MGYIKVDLINELSALNTLILNSHDFLNFQTIGAWRNRKAQIDALIQKHDEADFDFGLGDRFIIRTSTSQRYKGRSDNHPVLAKFYFGWKVRKCSEEPKYHRILDGGSNVVFVNDCDEELRHFHYDVCPGGTHINGSIAYHPITHFQFHGGALSDLPRIPTLLFSLADILEQTFIELWPEKWPEHTQTTGRKAALSRHHNSQKNRIELIGKQFISQATGSRLPLRGLQLALQNDLLFE